MARGKLLYAVEAFCNVAKLSRFRAALSLYARVVLGHVMFEADLMHMPMIPFSRSFAEDVFIDQERR